MNAPAPTALIAEDEPLLAAALQADLARAWPELRVLATVGDGLSAVKQALALAPDVLFFDIRMPGLSGLEAAAELADQWPPADAPERAFPALVFVTAYDEYAVQAFEAQAVDYLLKPVQAARLAKNSRKTPQSQRETVSSSYRNRSIHGAHAGASAWPAGRRRGRRRAAPERDRRQPARRDGRVHPHGAGGRGGCISRRPTSTCACSPPVPST
jgi:CheY-like chemotaxis protein